VHRNWVRKLALFGMPSLTFCLILLYALFAVTLPVDSRAHSILALEIRMLAASIIIFDITISVAKPRWCVIVNTACFMLNAFMGFGALTLLSGAFPG
jgi:hypothetical protein